MSDALRIGIGLALMVALGLVCKWMNSWLERRAALREQIRERVARVRAQRRGR